MLFQIGIKAEWRAHHGRLVLFLGNKNTNPLLSVQAIILPPSHLKIELSLVPETIPPRAQVKTICYSHNGSLIVSVSSGHSYLLSLSVIIIIFLTILYLVVQVQCPLEIVNLRPSRDVAVLDFSYKFGNNMVLLSVISMFFCWQSTQSQVISMTSYILFVPCHRSTANSAFLLF